MISNVTLKQNDRWGLIIMTALLTDEFYEHLYNLEQRSTATMSWISVVDDDDPDLLYCQDFAYKHFKLGELEDEMIDGFIEKIRECFEKGITSYRSLAPILNKKPATVERLIKKHRLLNELKYTEKLWNGLVCHNLDTDELIFAASTKALADYINASGPQVVRNAISRQKPLLGNKIYKAKHWKMVYPSFSLPQEEVLNNEIVRIA